MPAFMKLMQVYLNIAKEIASLSNCVSYQVGAIAVKDGRILATGYNGTPKGYKNCSHQFPSYDRNNEEQRAAHHEFSNMYEVHAEMNLLLFAARSGICVKGATLYCTTEPCMQCAKNIIQSGIKKIIYSGIYDRNFNIREDINTFYKECGLSVAFFDGEKLNWI